MFLGFWPGRIVLAGALVVFGFPQASAAQTGTPPAASQSARIVDASSALPAGTAWLDSEGHLVVRATRLPERLIVDGRLDEAMYTKVQPVGNFLQAEPRYNEPATEQTQVWVFFDDRAVYVSLRCFDSQPDQWLGLEMRREALAFSQNESVSIAFDTFHDKRNGLQFGANPVGGVMDTAITNERDSNRDWNAIWESRTAMFDGGWTVEMAIPFKSLRYADGEQTWGINVRRIVKWKNEISYLSLAPQSGQNAQMGLQRFSSAATLVGLESPPASRLFELKPYGISSVKTDRTSAVPLSNDVTGSLGFDGKYGLTKGLVADFTYNTDFAQVEDDEQQVNLTRFSLFFPEKREFFLEGQGIFAFGGLTMRRNSNPGEAPLPFFSRRIGLSDDGKALPILAGGRVTGRVGKYSIGAVNIQTKEHTASSEPATNFAVLRVRRDIMGRSNVGVVMVNRSAYGTKLRSNQTYGADGVFSFFENLNLNTFVARTSTPELRGDAGTYRAQLDYAGDRYGLVLERMAVGRNFNPEAGYVRRRDFVRHVADFRFSPRPRSSERIRRYDYSGSIDRFARGSDGLLETRVMEANFGIEFQSGDRMNVQVVDDYEQLTEPFEVFGSVTIPSGAYRFRHLRSEYSLGGQHRLSGFIAYEHGGFYGGTKKTLSFSNGRTELVPNFFVEPGLSVNWVDVPAGRAVAKVATSRFVYTFTPRTFVGGLVQYNSSNHSLSTNARLRWEYKPGSELFIVYSDGRDTLVNGFPGLETRALTVKITRFFRM
jgi:hypothetical protein